MIKINATIMLAGITFSSFGQEVIPLYNGQKPPGSEIFTLNETSRKDVNGEIITIRNVSMPTLTVYRPEKEKKNGTALIIAPGGGFQGLAFQQEGTATAKWCVEHGITAFILKYRLMPFPYPEWDKAQGTKRDSLTIPFVRMAVADGNEAIHYVRSHASTYEIDPTKIGLIGYSAGGTVVSSVALQYDKNSRPNFAVPVYAYCGAILDNQVPDDAPPLFLAWANDDFIAKGNTSLFEKWRDAKKSVEMHCFYSGGHGFSVNKQGKASDQWTVLLLEWMLNLGLITNN